jgi:hypothetical protein
MEVAVDLDQREILGKMEELLDLCLRAFSALGVVSVLRAPEATGLRGGVFRGSEPERSW